MIKGGEEIILTRRGNKLAKLSLYVDPEESKVSFSDFAALRKEIETDVIKSPNAILQIREVLRYELHHQSLVSFVYTLMVTSFKTPDGNNSGIEKASRSLDLAHLFDPVAFLGMESMLSP